MVWLISATPALRCCFDETVNNAIHAPAITASFFA